MMIVQVRLHALCCFTFPSFLPLLLPAPADCSKYLISLSLMLVIRYVLYLPRYLGSVLDVDIQMYLCARHQSSALYPTPLPSPSSPLFFQPNLKSRTNVTKNPKSERQLPKKPKKGRSPDSVFGYCLYQDRGMDETGLRQKRGFGSPLPPLVLGVFGTSGVGTGGV